VTYQTVALRHWRRAPNNLQTKAKHMQKFDLKNPTEWAMMLPGEVIEFDAPNSRRVVTITVQTNGPCSVHVGSDPAMTGKVLAAYAEGRFEVQYSAGGKSYVEFSAPEGTEIYIHSLARTHRVERIETPSYTNIEPRNRRNTEFDRMMQLMRYNEARRNEQQKAELAKLRDDLKAEYEAKEAKKAEREAKKAEREAKRAEREAAEQVVEEEATPQTPAE
jgi:hypothetical protein